jgi:epoxyqueuosine reductase
MPEERSIGVVEGNMPSIDSLLIEKAKALGFIAVGFSTPCRPLHVDHFKAWVAEGKNADMAWLARNLDVREDPSRMLSNCRTVISLAFPYSSAKPETKDAFSVARYADPANEDYHFRLRSLCKMLASFIEERHPRSKSKICVDSSPVMEKSLAVAAGLGFIGKNNLLIIPGYGSYFYLAEIFTTAAIPFDPAESSANQCGLCSLCLDACPMGALESPFVLDAARCLSYLTVEHKGTLDGNLSKKMGKCFFGCDRCQEVCPFNRQNDRPEGVMPSTDEFLNMEDGAFQARFGKTAFARAGIEKLKGNIRAARKNR